jgi:hypothetical protein
MKWLYRYPQAPCPYLNLIETKKARLVHGQRKPQLPVAIDVTPCQQEHLPIGSRNTLALYGCVRRCSRYTHPQCRCPRGNAASRSHRQPNNHVKFHSAAPELRRFDAGRASQFPGSIPYTRAAFPNTILSLTGSGTSAKSRSITLREFGQVQSVCGKSEAHM